jgi:mxaA protein
VTCRVHLPRVLAVLLVVCLAPAGAGAAVGSGVGAPRPEGVPAVVLQPRAFGHVLGDVVQQRVLLEAGGRAFEPKSLPAAARLGAWFERRPARLEWDAVLRRWLVIDYQIINAPKELANVVLPGWQIAAAGGGAPLKVPRWALSVAPLTPAERPSVAGMRPDLEPPRVARAPLQASLATALAALAVTVLAWLAWWGWRVRRAAARQPFARALRAMRGLDAREPRAWQALHRAFDQTAGRVVQAATLPALFEAAPHLTQLRGGIEAFFRQSSTIFFGSADAAGPVSPRELCERLRRLERRHER